MSERKVYYFQVVDGAGGGFYFTSSLKGNGNDVTVSTLSIYCNFIAELKDQTATLPNNEESKISSIENRPFSIRDVENNFTKLQSGMSPDSVIMLVGSPSKISLGSTGKEWIPLYFASDSRRTYWS